MFCKYCGAQVPDGAKFCPKCGASLMEEAAPAQPEEKPKAKSITRIDPPEEEMEEVAVEQEERPKKFKISVSAKPEFTVNKRTLYWVLALVVLMIIVGLCQNV